MLVEFKPKFPKDGSIFADRMLWWGSRERRKKRGRERGMQTQTLII